MKLVAVDHLDTRITPDQIVPGVFIKRDVVTKVEQGYVFTQDRMGGEILLGIIPHVLTDVNKRKCAFGRVEWEAGDSFLYKGKEFWTLVEDWNDSWRIQTLKFITVRTKQHFQEMLENGVLEPLIHQN